jgi:hypothetical protein
MALVYRFILHGATRLQNQENYYQEFQTEHIKSTFVLRISNANKSHLRITTQSLYLPTYPPMQSPFCCFVFYIKITPIKSGHPTPFQFALTFMYRRVTVVWDASEWNSSGNSYTRNMTFSWNFLITSADESGRRTSSLCVRDMHFLQRRYEWTQLKSDSTGY